MSWKAKAKEWGGGDFTFLSNDGETMIFVVGGEPQLLEGKFKGKPQQRIGCPVVTDEGFQLFVTGKRVFRKLSKFEEFFGTHAIMVTRSGAEGDIDATYNVEKLEPDEKSKQLLGMVKTEVSDAKIKEAVKDALEVMNQ